MNQIIRLMLETKIMRYKIYVENRSNYDIDDVKK